MIEVLTQFDAEQQAMPANVLLVEDDRSVRHVFQRLLARSGMNVTSAADAWTAMDVLRHETIDVVVSDIGLPMIDGLELARRIKADPNNRDVRLVAVSAYSHDDMLESARLAGFDAYFVKPVLINDLLQAIHGEPVDSDRLHS